MNQKLPKAVQEQLNKANELSEQMTATPETPAAVEEVPDTPVAPVEVQSVQETPVEPQVQPDSWEQKYRVLNGKYNAEVPRMAEVIREQKAKLEELQQTVAQIQQAAPAAAPQAPNYSFVTAEENEDYGADLLEVAARKAKEQYLPLIEQLQTKIAQLEGTWQQGNKRVEAVEQVTMQTARDRFFSQLDSTLPTWEALNTDPSFLNWLDSTDDLTGVPRRELFNRAYGALDSGRVAKFFSMYSREAGLDKAEAPRSNTMKPTVPLDQLQAPGKPRAEAPNQGKKTISRTEIAAFYDKVRKGFYKGREADASRFEQEIFAAQSEGRVS